MSYIKNEHTYAYPDGDGGMVIHLDNVIDQGPKHNGHRYLVRLSPEELREFVRQVIERTAPSWVKPQMVTEAVEKFFQREKL